MEKKIEDILVIERDNSGKIDKLTESISGLSVNIAVMAEQQKVSSEKMSEIMATQSKMMEMLIDHNEKLLKHEIAFVDVGENKKKIRILEDDNLKFRTDITASSRNIKIAVWIMSSVFMALQWLSGNLAKIMAAFH